MDDSSIFLTGQGQFDPDTTARQRLAEKYLDFGVDAAQVGCGAPLHRVKNRALRAQREGNAFRTWGPSSLGHDPVTNTGCRY
jgi:hypothetical protein